MSQRILVIEDDPINQKLFHDFFTAHGYRVSIARTGPEGVEKAAILRPDLVVCDVLLPQRSGFEVCFEIKRTPHGKKTPVFLMSAIYKDLEHAEGYARNDLKAQAYFVKPFDLERLLSHVQLFIGDA